MSEAAVIYGNLESFEGVVAGTETFNLRIYSRRILVQNDSGSVNLKFYPQGIESGNYITLQPTESITLDRFRTNTISITGNNTQYRIWVMG